MLDVHPPHKATHTWRDFFIHIATICVGLLIALCLEQAVEAINRSRERQNLREELVHESQQILKDSQEVDHARTAAVDWYTALEQQLADANKLHHPVGELPPVPHVGATVPDDPIFRAATASNQLALLSRSEVETYSEVHQLLSDDRVKSLDASQAYRDFEDFLRAQSFVKTDGTQPFADATPQDLKSAYDLAGKAERAGQRVQRSARAIEGAVTAIIGGERDLQKIDAAEFQRDGTPSSHP